MKIRRLLISLGLAGAGLLAFPSISHGQESNSNLGISRNLETRIQTEKTLKKLERKNMLNSKGFAIQDSLNKQNVSGFIYIATDKAFELTKTERKNFENYLRSGGFAVLESLTPELDYSQAEASLKQMLRDTLKNDARFLPIPNSHPLYHCFFDFDMPPQGAENKYFIVGENRHSGRLAIKSILSKPRSYLEGIFLDDRLAVVYSGKGYGKSWAGISDNESQQKIGVNFVVYALTQKGKNTFQ